MNKDLMEDLDKLTSTIVDVLKANKYKVTNKYPTSKKGIRVECKDFSLEAYTYAFLKAITIWLFIKPSKIDKYNHLIEQFKLIGFEVYTADKKTSEEQGIPLVREVYCDLDGKHLPVGICKTFIDENAKQLLDFADE